MKILKKYSTIILFIAIATLVSSCSEDDSSALTSDPFVVAFQNLSANLGEIEASQEINLVYSETTTQPGSVTLSLAPTNAVYGEDFTTNPPAEGNTLTLPLAQNENGTSFSFIKLTEVFDETVEINFSITSIDYPNAQVQGNTSFLLNSSASLGRGFIPTVGGPNQPNQVYIDLSTEEQTAIKRDAWDLGFYGGLDFRVGINGSIYMAAAALETSDIDAVTEASVAELQSQVAVGTFDPANEIYIDNPNGDIKKTAIASISETDSENQVYLINLGYSVGTESPAPGAVAVAGEARGWKKIRVLRQADGYLLQYANLNDTTHQEVFIPKNAAYNFTFFSFDTNTTVAVEPAFENWDINFTVFTNVLDGAGSYGFSDGVLHNRKGGVTVYSVDTANIAYDDFQMSDVISSNFNEDQRTIGSSWRDVINDDKTLIDNIFYIIKGTNGTIYKLKFTALLSDSGERGFPEFKYNLLQ